MRNLRWPVLLGCVFACLAHQGTARAEDREVKAAQTWTGLLDEKKLTEAAPAKGYLADAAEWKKLWEAWRPGEKLSEVDFKRQLVLVNLTGMYPVRHALKLTAEGDLKVQLNPMVPPKPGFGYGIAVVERAGIKSISGKAIE